MNIPYRIVGGEMELLQYYLRVHSALQYHKGFRLTERELTLLSKLLWEEDPFSTPVRRKLARELKLSPANYSTVLRILTEKKYLDRDGSYNYKFSDYLVKLRNHLIENDDFKLNVSFEVKQS
jgi:DNA-binding MarR family transcriptional regulator